MLKLLLLSAGTNAGFHIAKTIKEKFPKDFKIIGTDINKEYLISTSQYLDTFYQVSPSNNPKYYNEILKICQKEKINFLFPILDNDQKQFYAENKDLEQFNVVSLGIRKNIIPFYDNKSKMNKFLFENGFSIPRIYTSEECNLTEQYMVKPIDGFGSIGAGIRSGVAIKKMDCTNLLIQEVCKEPEITVECFWYNKQISTVCRERLATKAGVCTKTRVFRNTELEEVALKFAKILNPPYIFNLQFMKKAEGYVITDVNLRAAGGMSLSYAAGWDEVSALAKIMLKKKDIWMTLPKIFSEHYIVRAYTDIVTKIKKSIVAFDWDGTLLDSRKRHSLVLNDILKKLNIELDTSDLIDFKRNGYNNILYLQSKGISQKLAKKIQQEWIAHIEDEQYLKTDILYDDAIKKLNKYEECERILITARNKKDALFKQIESFNLTKKFNHIFVVQPGKKVAEQKAKILIENNAKLMIGDTKDDYKAAQIANIAFEYCPKGFHRKKVIKGE